MARLRRRNVACPRRRSGTRFRLLPRRCWVPAGPIAENLDGPDLTGLQVEDLCGCSEPLLVVEAFKGVEFTLPRGRVRGAEPLRDLVESGFGVRAPDPRAVLLGGQFELDEPVEALVDGARRER